MQGPRTSGAPPRSWASTSGEPSRPAWMISRTSPGRPVTSSTTWKLVARPSTKARDIQASLREGRNPHQHLEHRTDTSLLPLNSQASYNFPRNTIKKRSLIVLNFRRTPQAHRYGFSVTITLGGRLDSASAEPSLPWELGGNLPPNPKLYLEL